MTAALVRPAIVLCPGCDGPLVILVGEERRVCAECDTTARRVAHAKLSARERNRRWRVRRKSYPKANGLNDAGVSTSIVVITRHTRGSLVDGLRDRVEPPPRPAADLPVRSGDRYCECGRSLNLGRYKTGGDTCGQCKKAEARGVRQQAPLYASFEDVAKQLEDETPIEDDPYSGGEGG